MYIERNLKKTLEDVNKSFPVILLTGARQVGKTTFLKKSCSDDREYITLDDISKRNLAKHDPALFLQKYKRPILIDEIQYAPELLSQIKIEVDKNKQPGMFWLTGSQKFHLMKGVSESLAGRVAILNMLGFSLNEVNSKNHDSKPFVPNIDSGNNNFKSYPLMEIYKKIWLGSYPFLYDNNENNWEIFYQSYVSTYIERDIRSLTQVADERIFYNFLRATAARTGQMLNYSGLAKDVGISLNTAKNWISLLLTSGIIYLLEPYYVNRSIRMVKTPKMYFLDTGLCAFLTNWNSPETLEAGAMSGPFFETFVISEILKSYWHNGKNPPLYYYRDSNKYEIDLIIEKDGYLYPVEIKKSANPEKKHIKNFSQLKYAKTKIGDGAIICMYDGWLPITDTVNAYNIGVIGS